jgi:Protein of unknown function (DUF2934)
VAKRRYVNVNKDQPVINVEMVQRRAYEIYESRGRVDGAALEDWLQAEHELLDQAQRQPVHSDTQRM